MCKKILIVWDCNHTEEEDPRRCRFAQQRGRNCNAYAFMWAMRFPEREPHPGQCPDCIRAERAAERRRQDQAFVETSTAHPMLRIVSVRDDELREGTGRPRFDRSKSSSDMTAISRTRSHSPAQGKRTQTPNVYLDPNELLQFGAAVPRPEAFQANIAAVRTAATRTVQELVQFGQMRPEQADAYIQAAVAAALRNQQQRGPIYLRPPPQQQQQQNHHQRHATSPAAPSHPPPPLTNNAAVPTDPPNDNHLAPQHPLTFRSAPPPTIWQGPVLLDSTRYPHVRFLGDLPTQQRPSMPHAASYTGSVGSAGIIPPSAGAVGPREERAVEPPSRTPSPILRR